MCKHTGWFCIVSIILPNGLSNSSKTSVNSLWQLTLFLSTLSRHVYLPSITFKVFVLISIANLKLRKSLTRVVPGSGAMLSSSTSAPWKGSVTKSDLERKKKFLNKQGWEIILENMVFVSWQRLKCIVLGKLQSQMNRYPLVLLFITISYQSTTLH